MKIFIFLILTNLLLSQGLDLNKSLYFYHSEEIKAIENKNIPVQLFISPAIELKKKKYYNFINDNYSDLQIHPVMGLRYSNVGFEINDKSPQQVLWVSPGLNIKFNKLLFNFLNPVWINASFAFYKHSAYGIYEKLSTNNTLNNDGSNEPVKPIFHYNPFFSYGYHNSVQTDDKNGIEFDESIGGISIISNNFDVSFGKFRSSLGPSSYSNLSLSNHIPAFNQLRVNYAYMNDIFFTFIIGDLFSGIDDNSSYYEGRLKSVSRKLFNHRLDFKLLNNLRFGFYEQIITNPEPGSFNYYNPFQLYWSEQHQQGDVDNLQMGFDFDFLFKGYRIYGGILIDEWAPYDTFNEDAHNWFARQISLSKLFNVKSNVKGLFKFEYSDAEPQVYTHKFDINIPSHHNYPLGLWSGGDSINRLISFIVLSYIEKDKINHIFDITYSSTDIGNPVYEEGIALLSSQDRIQRNVLYFIFQKSLFNQIDYNFKVGYYTTENLYSEDNFLEFSTSILYNIQK